MFTTAVRVERDLGVPSVSFNTLTGHRSCAQRGKNDPIGGRVLGPGHLSAEHGELVTQDRDLDIVRMGRPTAADHAEDPLQNKQRQGPHHHGSRSCQARITAAHGRALTLHPSGITVVRSGVQTLRMNAIMERWVRTCRRELLDRTLIWNQRHLLHALREFEIFYNKHLPHQGIANARPLAPLPEPISDPDRLAI